jgi:hypothetical protein
MLIKRDRIDGLRVATPCPASWDEMHGDERMRFCDSCNLHVYNISAMSRREAEALISRTEGRICGRFYRRADGTILTKDCPVGLRALRRRAAKVAGAAVTAILSLCVSAFGKISPRGLLTGGIGASITRANSAARGQYNQAEIAGRVLDPSGQALEQADIKIVDQDTGRKAKAKSDARGNFRFTMLPPGTYTIEVEVAGFAPFADTFTLGASDKVDKDIVLNIGFIGIVVVEETKGSYKGPGSMSVFSGDKVRRLPF